MMTRREALQKTVLATACATLVPGVVAHAASPKGFEVPPLPYPVDALEPHIDARTMEIHHDKHHVAYATNLTKALAEHSALAAKPIEEILKNLTSVPEAVRTAVRNNGGGHYNHTLFWQMMKKGGGGQPTSELAKAIDTSFGNFTSFKEKFTEAASKVFGSGWAWLVLENGRLRILATSNAETPLTTGQTALLTIDVWEHAYYPDYQHRRLDYIAAFLGHLVNWEFANENLRRSLQPPAHTLIDGVDEAREREKQWLPR